MKKRILSLFCAVIMLMAVCVPAFAAGNGDDGIVTYGFDDEYYCIKIDGITKTVPAKVILAYRTYLKTGFVVYTQGKYVETAQMALNNVAKLYGTNCSTAVDGIYGLKSIAAVEEFHSKHPLSGKDGDEVGPYTWGKFVELCR